MLNNNERDAAKALAATVAAEACFRGLDQYFVTIQCLIAEGRLGAATEARQIADLMLQETLDIIEDATLSMSPSAKKKIVDIAKRTGTYPAD